MIDISAWANELGTICAGSSRDLCQQTVRAAIRQFCVDSGAWIRLLDPLDLEAGTVVYDLNANLTDAMVRSIMKVGIKIEGSDGDCRFLKQIEQPNQLIHQVAPTLTPLGYYSYPENPAHLTLHPPPAADQPGALQVYVSLRPLQNFTEVPDLFESHWFDTILSGCVGRMQMTKDRPWSDPGNGRIRMKEFRSGISEARDEARRQFVYGSAAFGWPAWVRRRGRGRRHRVV